MLTALFFVIQGLCFLANLRRGTSESGTRHDRIWEEVRSRLGRDTTASGTVFANKYRIWFIGVVAPCFTRCCHVACAMWWIYIEVALAFRHRDTPFENVKSKYDFLLCLRLRMVFLSVMFSIPYSVSSGIASFIRCCCAVSYIVPIFLWPMPACQLQHRLRLQSPLQSSFR